MTASSQTAPRTPRSARIPLWRRFTAVISLAAMVLIGGLVLAGLITITILLLIFLVEQAIA